MTANALCRSLAGAWVLAGALLFSGEAGARCAGWTPGPKPQNVGRTVVGQDYDTIMERGHIVFGVYEAFPPYSSKSQDGLSGVDVEVGRAVARRMGLTARFHAYAADETLEDDLRNNVWKGHYIGHKVVNVMLHVPYDSEFACRVEQAVFMGQYFNETLSLAFRTDLYPDEVPVPAYFRYDKVGVEIDTLPDQYLSGFAKGQLLPNIRRYPSPMDAMTALKSGDLAAVMGLRAQLEHGRNDGIEVAASSFPGLAKTQWPIGMAVRHTYRQLGYAVDDAVKAAVADDEIKQIFKKHGVSWSAPVW